VCIVRMDASVRDEAEKVQTAIAFCRGLKGVDDGLLFCEFALFDGLIDADEVLPDYSASSDVQVSHWGSSVSPGGSAGGKLPSELPISPSGSPTARPWASSSQKGYSFSNLSMTGVFALPIASPFGFPSGGQIPQPIFSQ